MCDEIPPMPKTRTSLSLDTELLDKINKHIVENYTYKDRSHFFEVLARKYFETLDK